MKHKPKYYISYGMDDALNDCFCIMNRRHQQVGVSYMHRSSARRKLRKLLNEE